MIGYENVDGAGRMVYERAGMTLDCAQWTNPRIGCLSVTLRGLHVGAEYRLFVTIDGSHVATSDRVVAEAQDQHCRFIFSPGFDHHQQMIQIEIQRDGGVCVIEDLVAESGEKVTL